ncbi:hypothetical protein WJX84_000450 [Apatococcus fuscideae]|uniref:Uncharacterized protein n=1 Tax=Apatococcus fuscideae TaxID=2026836 RepID=A0AAW1SQT0_9CHLO
MHQLLTSRLSILFLASLLLTANLAAARSVYPLADQLQLHHFDSINETRGSARHLSSQAESGVDIISGYQWPDTAGVPIQAHGGAVLHHAGKYYWYGVKNSGYTYFNENNLLRLPRSDIDGINVYSSFDLVNWQEEGIVLEMGHHKDLQATEVVARPRVVYCEHTSKFVMWLHIDVQDLFMAKLGVAMADEPTGPFTYVHSFQPQGHDARDFTLFRDDDGTGYVFYASEWNGRIRAARLDLDMANVQQHFADILWGVSREAPVIFKAHDHYFMLVSGCNGFFPTELEVYYAKEPLGQWTSMGNPAQIHQKRDHTKGYWAQPTAIIPMPGGKEGEFVLMMDQWKQEDLATSGYVWLPFFVTKEQHTTVHALQSTSIPEHRRHEVRCRMGWLDAWRIASYVDGWTQSGTVETSEEPSQRAHGL